MIQWWYESWDTFSSLGSDGYIDFIYWVPGSILTLLTGLDSIPHSTTHPNRGPSWVVVETFYPTIYTTLHQTLIASCLHKVEVQGRMFAHGARCGAGWWVDKWAATVCWEWSLAAQYTRRWCPEIEAESQVWAAGGGEGGGQPITFFQQHLQRSYLQHNFKFWIFFSNKAAKCCEGSQAFIAPQLHK